MPDFYLRAPMSCWVLHLLHQNSCWVERKRLKNEKFTRGLRPIRTAIDRSESVQSGAKIKIKLYNFCFYSSSEHFSHETGGLHQIGGRDRSRPPREQPFGGRDQVTTTTGTAIWWSRLVATRPRPPTPRTLTWCTHRPVQH